MDNPSPSRQRSWAWLSVLIFLFNHVAANDAYAQRPIPVYREFAIGETHEISGICLGCAVESPEKAVGNNTQDCSVFKMGLAVLGSIRQTLIFKHRTIDRFTKLSIGIGTGHTRLSVRLLGQVSVETFSGDTSNNDSRPVDVRMLKIYEDSTKGELEFITSKPYDRVRITLNGGLADINDELRVYFADQTYGDFSLCYGPHFAGETLYYSFDGDSKDFISGKDLTSTLLPTYQDHMLCGRQGLSVIPCLENTLQHTLAPWSLGDTGTVGFWARIDRQAFCNETPKLRVEVPPLSITLTADSVTACKTGLGCKTSHVDNPGGLNLFVVTTIPAATNPIRLFINGIEAPVPLEARNTPPLDGHLKVSLNQAQIDEMIVYKKVQSFRTIRSWYTDNCLQCQVSPLLAATHKASLQPSAATPGLYPNPTTGRVTIGGDATVNDVEMAVKNAAGMEVYRTRISTKTFELPSSLANGIYMITLTTKDHKVHTYKIVLSR
ncbi:Por secretion system C-terminal sorting domain-containing protein [Chitinophaga eiseniae]|uniref:Por secretion system C-terminal sorting domain-containing protein n=1 Tax=Chitinophaga eiseniae TaxID=634771 RepID=A0A1T4MEY6_9BACT|nr:T9SS type A sorting domain-containing protein [Chitinophaga eiseniae]SJZ65338.1 Por secretion system C-terminal sorting domain-containing protein [Chitinophaga eiseniae]